MSLNVGKCVYATTTRIPSLMVHLDRNDASTACRGLSDDQEYRAVRGPQLGSGAGGIHEGETCAPLRSSLGLVQEHPRAGISAPRGNGSGGRRHGAVRCTIPVGICLAEAAHALAQDACAPSNQAKFAYTHLVLTGEGEVKRVTAEVAVFGSIIRMCIEPPVIVGITLEPDTALPNLMAKCLARAEYVKRFLRSFQAVFLLAARSVMVYVVSKPDSATQGSFLPPKVLAALQPAVNSMYRIILGVPSDTLLGVLYIPVWARG